MLKKVLLMIGGGIAAHKTLELIRLLRAQGIAVECVLTPAAKHFVTPLSVAALSGMGVHEELFSVTHEAQMGHIVLSRTADLIVVAPATADLLAKAAQGFANDLASTLLLATDKKVLFAPAMNVRMWQHPAVQNNVRLLQQNGSVFCGPDEGEMACGEFGPGRMSEPAQLLKSIMAHLVQDDQFTLPTQTSPKTLAGRHIIITSGPTHEPIDPVRYIANRSSGKQGHAIAQAALAAGARVTLIKGPVHLPDPTGAQVIGVETALEMLAAVKAALPADVFIGTAAVSDWRLEDAARQKLKKDTGKPQVLALTENPDILAYVARQSDQRPKLVIGFAAETQQLIVHAQAKLQRKGCDFILANDVSEGTGVFGGMQNHIHFISRATIEDWLVLEKDEVARRLMDKITQALEKIAK